MILQCRNKTLDLTQPRVMGILNLTPDSFHDGGLHQSDYLKHVEKMLCDGASIIDIGGMSSRPGAEVISPELEIARIERALCEIIAQFPEAIISVDTIHSQTARVCLDAGAHMINDITASTFDEQMLGIVALSQAAICLMHSKGTPATMQQNPQYNNVTAEVFEFLKNQISKASQAGIRQIIADVGFGFGKTLAHNYELLRNLRAFRELQVPLLCGVSRKSMINKVLRINAADALNGTTAVHMLCLMNGANILRVHDVKEAIECIEIYNEYMA